MKKAFSILLIGVLIFSVVGYEIIFSLMLYRVKENGERIITSGERTENEVVIVINSANRYLLHRQNDHEVEFAGIMYDVRKEEQRGSDLVLHAVMDLNEQNLVNNFRLENKKGNSGKHSKKGIFNKDFSRLYLISKTIRKPERKFTSKITPLPAAGYSQPDRELSTPPPQFFSV